jgi:DNA-3-methyladenine glycosylase II
MPSQKPLRRLTRAHLATGVAQLCRQEPVFRAQVKKLGLPPLWERDPGYETLVRIILEQQVALASANALRLRLIERLGAITPRTMADAGVDGLRALGMTRQKSGYCVGIAELVLDGRLDFTEIARADDETAHAMLVALKGVGPWTAAIYQLMALRRPDIWPRGDLALDLALAKLRGLDSKPHPVHAAELTAAWAPWRSVGARLLWQGYLHAQGSKLAP